MPDHAKEYTFDVIEFTMRANESCFEFRKMLMNVYNYADILVEGAFRAIECRLADMNVFLHYCLNFSANECVFSLNEIPCFPKRCERGRKNKKKRCKRFPRSFWKGDKKHQKLMERQAISKFFVLRAKLKRG